MAAFIRRVCANVNILCLCYLFGLMTVHSASHDSVTQVCETQNLLEWSPYAVTLVQCRDLRSGQKTVGKKGDVQWGSRGELNFVNMPSSPSRWIGTKGLALMIWVHVHESTVLYPRAQTTPAPESQKPKEDPEQGSRSCRTAWCPHISLLSMKTPWLLLLFSPSFPSKCFLQVTLIRNRNGREFRDMRFILAKVIHCKAVTLIIIYFSLI